jgi:predicted RND superfamily exporter protein
MQRGTNILLRIATIGALGMIVFNAGQLLSKVKPFKIQELLDKDHPVRVAYETYKQDFNDEPRAFLLIKKKVGHFTDSEIHSVGQTLKDELSHNLHISKISSPVDASYISYADSQLGIEPFLDLSSFSTTAKQKLSEEFYKNTSFNKDRSALMFYIDFLDDIPNGDEYAALDQFVQLGKKYEKIWPSVTIHPMGTKVANFYFTKEMILNQTIITPLLLLAIAFFIFFMYRSVSAIVYILTAMILSYI